MMEMAEPNTCFRGCCWSEGIRLHCPPSSYSLNSIISRGSESTVFEATLLGRRVVAKKPVLSTSDDLDKFHRQLQLLCKMDHASLAKLVAANSMPPNYLLFFDLYEMGSVAHKLHVEQWSPSVKEALVIAYGLANALKYMHELGIVHRDVKPGNILLDSKLHPYLADFGLASDKKDLKQVSLENWKSSGKPTGGFHKKNMVGTLIYMAPEILRRNIHTEKSDVYSFAISINELLAGVVPYTDLRAEAQAHTVLEMSYTELQLTTAVVSGLRPVLASSVSGLPPRLMALIQRCWDSNSVFRPSFNDITKELDEILMDATKVDVGKSSMMLLSSLSRQCPNGIDNPHNFQENLNWFNQGELASKQVDEGMKSAELWPSFLDEPLHYRPTLSWGSFSTFGRREKMEDTHFLLPHMCNDLDIHLFGIFDGHRGVAAAEFSVRALPGFLKRYAHNSSPSEALCKAFVNTDIAFRKEMALRCNSKRVAQKDMYSGCTALVALIVRNKLFVANAGDCRAVLCRSGLPFPLSKEHIASCGKERTRVTNEGMIVTWQVDTWRVGTAALQVTRSIGDDDLKPAVTAEPEITETCLSGLDEFLVMASDGLWDVLSNERVISIIRGTVKEPTMCSKRLVTEAVERGSGDNITVIVVFLAAVSTAERVY